MPRVAKPQLGAGAVEKHSMEHSRSLTGIITLVLALALIAPACGDSDPAAASTPEDTASGAESELPPPQDLDGQFVLDADELGAQDARWADTWGTEGLLAATVEDLNEELRLPTDVTVHLQSSDDRQDDTAAEGPYYDPAEEAIYMPVVFADDMVGQLEAAGVPVDEAVSLMELNSVFVLIHEAAHAIIDVAELPITAREEDSADALAVVLMTQGDLQEDVTESPDAEADDAEGGNAEGEGAEKVLSEIPGAAARVFEVLAVEEEYDESDFWDEHSLGAQRAATIACLTFGSDPEAFEDMAESMEPERAEGCPAEYAQVARGWFQLLTPLFVDQPG